MLDKRYSLFAEYLYASIDDSDGNARQGLHLSGFYVGLSIGPDM